VPGSGSVAAGRGSVILISSPGSYYLTADVSVPADMNGIEITASNVTLDLNGFSVDGAAGSLKGIAVTAPAPPSPRNLAIRNGTVRGMGEDGVDAGIANNVQVRDLRVENWNTTAGGPFAAIRSASVGTISDCTIVGSSATTSGDGIVVGSGFLVTRCSVAVTQGAGIRASDGSTIITNSIWGNRINAVVCTVGCTIAKNTCDLTLSGAPDEASILVGSRCHVFANNCSSFVFAVPGIRATGNQNRIDGNHVRSDAAGIVITGIANIIVRNTVNATAVPPYSIGAGNAFGGVVAVGGGGAFAGVDPWANFTY
jgi:hypothetical protein